MKIKRTKSTIHVGTFILYTFNQYSVNFSHFANFHINQSIHIYLPDSTTWFNINSWEKRCLPFLSS